MPGDDQGNPDAVLEECLAVFCDSLCQENQRPGTPSWNSRSLWWSHDAGWLPQAHPLQEMVGWAPSALPGSLRPWGLSRRMWMQGSFWVSPEDKKQPGASPSQTDWHPPSRHVQSQGEDRPDSLVVEQGLTSPVPYIPLAWIRPSGVHFQETLTPQGRWGWGSASVGMGCAWCLVSVAA